MLRSQSLRARSNEGLKEGGKIEGSRGGEVVVVVVSRGYRGVAMSVGRKR